VAAAAAAAAAVATAAPPPPTTSATTTSHFEAGVALAPASAEALADLGLLDGRRRGRFELLGVFVSEGGF